MYSTSDFDELLHIIIGDVPEAEEIILFGSYASGCAHEESDIDILVLLSRDYDWIEKRNVLNKIYLDTAHKGYLVDFILKNKNDFELDKKNPTISKTIAKEGKWLWKRA
jgi:predicted nucleotidyltransferase